MARHCALLVGLLACAAEGLSLRQQLRESALQQEAQGLDRYVARALAHIIDACDLHNHTTNHTDVALSNHSNASMHAASHANASLPCKGRAATLAKEQSALQDLLSHLKRNIAKFNSAESSGKSEGAKMVEEVQARLERDQAQLKNASVSKWEHELLVNRTGAEERELKYWKRGRELQHGMFHANLKMTHGLMSKVRTVIEAYKEVLARGKISPKLAKDIKMVSANVPVPVALLETA